MRLSAILGPLLDAKADHELIRQIVVAHEAEASNALEQRRIADAARQARKRVADKSRDITLRHSDRALTGDRDTRGLDNSLPQKIEQEESKKEQIATSAKRDVDAFKSELSSDLDPELLDSFVKVRRNKRGTMTGFAAKLFRGDAAKCGMSVAEAATECVRSSWITVKPAYFEGRPRAGPAPPKPNPVLAAADALMEKFDAVSPSPTDANPSYPRLVAFSGGG